MTQQLRRFAFIVAITLVGVQQTWAQSTVVESARDLPIAYDVDVAIVGGSTGGVAAAIEAAKQGASVFLAAPLPYLGEDMTGTLRLWLEPGEQPASALAQLLFDDPQRESLEAGRLAFTYKVDTPSDPKHADSTPPNLLTDGRWQSASTQSVQYNADTQIIADLGSVQQLGKVRVVFYRRRGEPDTDAGFDVGKIIVSVSDDRQTWEPLGEVVNDLTMRDIAQLSLPATARARYVKLQLQLAVGYQRMLLGEVQILRPPTEAEIGATALLPPRPMHVKKELDDALIRAGVSYLYSCCTTDVLTDSEGNVAGIVMANRAGRQAVLAKTVIDATPRAGVARMAGVRFRPFPAGDHTFQRVVVGGQPQTGSALRMRVPAPPFGGGDSIPADSESGYQIYEYTLTLPVVDASYGAYMRADQQARTLTYDEAQQYTSDLLCEIPSDSMHAVQEATGPWQGPQALPLDALRPKRPAGLWVLGGCADVSREQAAGLVRPLALIDLGTRLGRAAAEQAGARKAAVRDTLVVGQPFGPATGEATYEVRENLSGVRPVGTYATVHQAARNLPVLGTYDVVVIGGGTGGAPAGIGAARQGAKTLVIEYLYGLGGVGTEGAISSYYWGNRVGFTASVLDGATRWPIEPKKEWYRRQLLDAGAELWFGTLGCGAVLKDNQVVGAVVATPYGRGVVLAKTVIDATGNSDVAAAAGAKCDYTDSAEFGMQGTGLPGRRLGESYNNTDFTIVDETDVLDIWRMFVFSKEKYGDAFDHGRLIDTRERRRIVGDFTISILDEINQRTYPDTVCRSYSNFDTHGYTIDPYFLLEHPEKVGFYVDIPLRAMLPQGLENIIVTGLSISAQRDAVPLIRMQADIQNGGYAAGVAAAMAGYVGVPVRHIDVKRLQEHLVKLGNLPPEVLEAESNYPLSGEQFAAAARSLPDGKGAAVLMTDPARAIPYLRAELSQATGDQRLVYARALAVLGQADGVAELIQAVRDATTWDKGWNYKGMGQFGAALSPLDELIVSLGRSGSPETLPVILEKLQLLDARSDFSHHRAVGLALELLGDPRAAQPLAELLGKPDMTGHVQGDINLAKEQGAPGGTNAERTRRESLRELVLARALFRCGDYQGLGEKILRQYTADLRGHLARHAAAVLAEKESK